MSGVKVADYVSKSMELLQSVWNTLFISTLSLLAFRVTHISCQVWKRIWFDDCNNRHIWILFENFYNFINISSFICVQSLAARVIFASDLTIRSSSWAVSIWQVVDNKHSKFSTFLSSLENRFNWWNFSHAVNPVSSSNIPRFLKFTGDLWMIFDGFINLGLKQRISKGRVLGKWVFSIGTFST